MEVNIGLSNACDVFSPPFRNSTIRQIRRAAILRAICLFHVLKERNLEQFPVEEMLEIFRQLGYTSRLLTPKRGFYFETITGEFDLKVLFTSHWSVKVGLELGAGTRLLLSIDRPSTIGPSV